MSQMAVMDGDGDTRISWNPNNEAEVAIARAAFDTARGRGMTAYRVDGDAGGAVIREFDPRAENIVMRPAMQGG